MLIPLVSTLSICVDLDTERDKSERPYLVHVHGSKAVYMSREAADIAVGKALIDFSLRIHGITRQ